jgi:hypothetical protein
MNTMQIQVQLQQIQLILIKNRHTIHYSVTLTEIPKFWEKILSQCHFCPPQIPHEPIRRLTVRTTA